jgi:hypothetical protein
MKTFLAVLAAVVGTFCVASGTKSLAQGVGYVCTYDCNYACNNLTCYPAYLWCIATATPRNFETTDNKLLGDVRPGPEHVYL